MKNLKKLGLVAGLATLMSFSAEAQSVLNLQTITSNDASLNEGGELQLNDPNNLGTNPSINSNRWIMDNYKSSLRIFRTSYNSSNFINFMDRLYINRNEISIQANTRLNDFDLIFRNNGGVDNNHGLGYYGTLTGTTNKLFDSKIIDGPVLYGYSGGALGSNRDGIQKVALQWDNNGSVGIGLSSPYNFPSGYKLAVEGSILAQGVKVALRAQWPDYVFKKDYKLRPLAEVEQFITTNNHLPDVPSETAVKENGIDVANMDAVLLRKVEELTLYMIQLQKDNLELKAKLEALSK